MAPSPVSPSIMPSPAQSRVPFLLLFSFLLLIIQLPHTSANRIQTVKQCAGSSIPIHPPNNHNYHRLKALSFRSNFATPLAIAEARNEWQVSRLVICARKAQIRVCARSGGHSLIGHNLCKGLVIDLSNMRQVSMKPGFVAHIQPGAVMGEVLWTLHKSKRWMAAGVCPAVGFAGYVLGGGHGPYEGKLGMACDSMLSLRMVDRFGKILDVSKKKRPFLFWAMCGAGGGQFGIVTAFRWRTASSQQFDKAVVFRFRWPVSRGGELLDKWQRYGEWGGAVWFRMEIYLANRDRAVFGYGACYGVKNVAECMGRLNKAPFFNTPGRSTTYISTVRNALDLHAFFGPKGGWGSYRASNLYEAMLQQRGTESGQANDRIYQSTFLRGPDKKGPSIQFWQQYVNFCQSAFGAKSIPWVVCEMNLFNNAIDWKQNNAFPFRQANLITHFIIGGGSTRDRTLVYNRMKNHLRPFTMGVYVNYPELFLENYAKSYWGANLGWLKRVKKLYDPFNFFMNPQPIPKS